MNIGNILSDIGYECLDKTLNHKYFKLWKENVIRWRWAYEDLCDRYKFEENFKYSLMEWGLIVSQIMLKPYIPLYINCLIYVCSCTNMLKPRWSEDIKVFVSKTSNIRGLG